MPSQIQKTRGKAAYRRAADAAARPVNTVRPAITGTLTQGQTLTCSIGTWTNTPDAYAYQWLRAGVAIGGATASTRVLAAADVGNAMTCTVTAANLGISVSATSLPTAVITAA
jgi:hypothetical protein